MTQREPIDLCHARDALASIDPACTRAEWHRIGCAAIAAGLAVEDIDAWSSQAANYGGERDVRAAFRGVEAGGLIGVGTLWRAALAAGWRPPRNGEPARTAGPAETSQAPRQLPARPVPLSARMRKRWADLEPPAGPALAYLNARHAAIPPAPGDLRWSPAWRHPSGYVGPALVALITDARTGEPISMHSTWICADGTKPLQADPARLLLAGHRKAGGVIRLWPDEDVTTGLAVAEGIETALSLAHAFQPVWACIDAGNLATLPVLAGIEALTVAVDHDAAGIEAANRCAHRWHADGREVFFVQPQEPRTDINDVAARSAA